MHHQPTNELLVWLSKNILVCSWSCFKTISTSLVIWKHILLNFDCVSTNIVNWILTSTRKNVCFWCFPVSYSATLCLRKGSYWILRRLQPKSTCRNKKPPRTFKFSTTSQFYRCFFQNFAFIMAPITKLLQEIEVFQWTPECQQAWKVIK